MSAVISRSARPGGPCCASTSVAMAYDPGEDAWETLAPAGSGGLAPLVLPLPDGRVLVSGGYVIVDPAPGYDDVTVYAPIAPVVETGDRILGTGGCLNFFAGPTDPGFSASVNFYKVHYGGTHIVGTTGGNTDDLLESLAMSAEKRINPAVMITHIGGLDTYVETTLNLPKIPGGKKLIYTGIRMPLTAIEDFETLGKSVPLFAELHKICDRHAGLWCAEAEAYLLNNTPLHYSNPVA